jgi:hypothetical protein
MSGSRYAGALLGCGVAARDRMDGMEEHMQHILSACAAVSKE